MKRGEVMTGRGVVAIWCCRQLQTAFYLSLSESCFQSTREAQSPVVPTPQYLHRTVISCLWVCVDARVQGVLVWLPQQQLQRNKTTFIAHTVSCPNTAMGFFFFWCSKIIHIFFQVLTLSSTGIPIFGKWHPTQWVENISKGLTI